MLFISVRLISHYPSIRLAIHLTEATAFNLQHKIITTSCANISRHNFQALDREIYFKTLHPRRGSWSGSSLFAYQMSEGPFSQDTEHVIIFIYYCAFHVLVQPNFRRLILLFARSSSNSPLSFQRFRRTLVPNFNWIREQMKNFPMDPNCKNCPLSATL